MLEPMPHPSLLHIPELEPEQLRPLTYDDYMRLSEMGVFDDEKVELLGGVVVVMHAQGPMHMKLMALLTRFLAKRLPASHMITPATTYRLSEYSAPEPDLAVVHERTVFAGRQIADWIIEVSVTSQRKDLGIKRRLYGAAGLAEYWVIDAVEMVVVVHRDPIADGYASVTRHARDERIAPLQFPDLLVSLDELLEDRARLV